MSEYATIKYTESDTVNSLSKEQLEFLAMSGNEFFLGSINPRHWDVQRIRLLMELGIEEAKRRTASTPPTYAQGQEVMRDEIIILATAAMHGFRSRDTATRALVKLLDAIRALPIKEGE